MLCVIRMLVKSLLRQDSPRYSLIHSSTHPLIYPPIHFITQNESCRGSLVNRLFFLSKFCRLCAFNKLRYLHFRSRYEKTEKAAARNLNPVVPKPNVPVSSFNLPLLVFSAYSSFFDYRVVYYSRHSTRVGRGLFAKNQWKSSAWSPKQKLFWCFRAAYWEDAAQG